MKKNNSNPSFKWNDFYDNNNRRLVEKLLDLKECRLGLFIDTFFPINLSPENPCYFSKFDPKLGKTQQNVYDFLQEKIIKWYKEEKGALKYVLAKQEDEENKFTKDAIIQVESIFNILLSDGREDGFLPLELLYLPQLSNSESVVPMTENNFTTIYENAKRNGLSAEQVESLACNFITHENKPIYLSYHELIERWQSFDWPHVEHIISKAYLQGKLSANFKIDRHLLIISWPQPNRDWRELRRRNSGNPNFLQRVVGIERLKIDDPVWGFSLKRLDQTGVIYPSKPECYDPKRAAYKKYSYGSSHMFNKLETTDMETKLGIERTLLPEAEKIRQEDMLFLLSEVVQYEIKENLKHFEIDEETAKTGLSNFEICSLEEAAKLLKCSGDNVIDRCMNDPNSFSWYLKRGNLVVKSVFPPCTITQLNENIAQGKIDIRDKYHYRGLLRMKKEARHGEEPYAKYALEYLRTGGTIKIKHHVSSSCSDPLDSNFSLGFLPLQPSLSEIVMGTTRAECPPDQPEVQITIEDVFFIKEELLAYLAKKTSVSGKEKLKEPQTNIDLSQKNSFVLKGDYYSVKYNGTEAILNANTGERYICALLKNKGKKVNCPTLVKLITDDGSVWATELPEEYITTLEEQGISRDISLPGYNDEVIDKKTMNDSKKRLIEIKELIENYEETGDTEKIEELKSEEEIILNYLRSSLNIKNRSRSFSDIPTKARQAVQKNIRRALDKLKGKNEPLYEHLNDSLTTGAECSYIPKEDITWTF